MLKKPWVCSSHFSKLVFTVCGHGDDGLVHWDKSCLVSGWYWYTHTSSCVIIFKNNYGCIWSLSWIPWHVLTWFSFSSLLKRLGTNFAVNWHLLLFFFKTIWSDPNEILSTWATFQIITPLFSGVSSFKSSGMWIQFGLLDPEKETWGTTRPYNTAPHPKILQHSTQLIEPQSCIKEVVSESQTQHNGAGMVETDHNQVSTFTTHAKQESFWYFTIHLTWHPLQLLYSTEWTGMDMEGVMA